MVAEEDLHDLARRIEVEESGEVVLPDVTFEEFSAFGPMLLTVAEDEGQTALDMAWGLERGLTAKWGPRSKDDPLPER